MQIHLHEERILQIHNARPEFVKKISWIQHSYIRCNYELNVNHDNGIYHLVKQENLFNKNGPQWY